MKQNFLLRLARINAGLTQEELADILGVTVVTIYRWERGENTPNPYFRARLCKLFQLSEQELGLQEPEKGKTWSRDDRSSFLIDPYPSASRATPIGQQSLLHEMEHAYAHHHTIGLMGLPGSGKTAIAHLFTTQQNIRQRVEGVFWATVGQNADPLRHLQRWLMLLGEETSSEQVEGVQDQLRVALRGRKFLIVLDDIWNAEDIIPYQLPHCRYLITTRLTIVANTVCDRIFFPRVLTEMQAFHLLSHDLPIALVREHREILRALCQQVGNLPLAIEQMKKYLRREARSYSQRRFQETLAHLFRPITYLNIQIPPDPYSLAASIKRSEERLSLSSRKAFFILTAHFPSEPGSFSEQQAGDLIQASQQFQLRDLDQLVDMGLLSVTRQNRYQFHPIIAAYARLLSSTEDSSP